MVMARLGRLLPAPGAGPVSPALGPLAPLVEHYRLWRSEAGSILRSPHHRAFVRWSVMRAPGSCLRWQVPWMPFEAADWLTRQVAPGMRVFEFGIGGSTRFWLRLGARVVGVEHDGAWASRMTTLLRDEQAAGRAELMHVPPAPLAATTPPRDASDPDAYRTRHPPLADCDFRDYARSIERFADESFDIVVVDGRARPSCMKHAHRKVKRGGLFVLDNADRDYYWPALAKFFGTWRLVGRFTGLGPEAPIGWRTDVYERPT